MKRIKRYWLLVMMVVGVVCLLSSPAQAAWLSTASISSEQQDLDIILTPESGEVISALDIELSYDDTSAIYTGATSVLMGGPHEVQYSDPIDPTFLPGKINTVAMAKYDDLILPAENPTFQNRVNTAIPQGTVVTLHFSGVSGNQFVPIVKACASTPPDPLTQSTDWEVPVYLRADFDKSGVVGLGDLTAFAQSWGQTDPLYDLVVDASSSINLADFTLFSFYWGQGPISQ